ncbi:tetratricopeptide repeat protein [Actinomadura meridiana]|uniref:Tetratricopeptide repeat protein n=1 Tax=Actinomadura meridiana TaxID=559626 RepID=A0ABP8CJI8_9ACTN
MRAIDEWRGRHRPMCVVLSGLAGAGKTELAFRIARNLRERHQDIEAVLYVDLDDLRVQGAVSATDVLGELLRALDVAPEWLKGSLRERQRQYSVKTDGRRLVVLVDNARYGSEVVPLLPASESAVVIVTSQARLFDLEAGAAVEVAVEPLGDADAMELLQRITEDPRLAAEPDTSIELVRLCSGLPGAVHAAGHLLRKHRRRSLPRLLSELATDLQEKGLPVVEKVWDAAYRDLSADAALLYRLLADFPGPSFTDEAVTALLGRGRDAADDALEELENASLLDLRTGRMRLPDLLRAHARRRARRDGGSEEATDGRRRIVEWYLRQAQRADTLAAGKRMRLAEPRPPIPGAPDVQFAGKGQALRWLESERHVLNGCVREAYAYGLDETAWALCEPLWTHYLDFPHYEDVVDAFTTGLAAAQRTGDVAAVARMRCQLARPYWEQGRFDEAGRELEAARNAAAALGTSEPNSKIKASVVEFRGMLHGARGEWRAAAADFETSREMHQAIPNEYGVMLLTYRLGQALAELRENDRAAALLRQAHDKARALQRERMTARTGVALAGVMRRLGEADQAHALYVAALESARERDSTYDQARILRSLAAAAEEAGDPAQAEQHRQMADALRDRSGGFA